MESVRIESLTSGQLAEQLAALEVALGMPVEIAEDLAAAGALDPDRYQVLRRVRDLRWLQAGC